MKVFFDCPYLETIKTGKGKIKFEYGNKIWGYPESFFIKCPKLKEIYYNASSTEVFGSVLQGIGLFQGVETATDLYIGKNVTAIPEYTFDGCKSLNRIWRIDDSDGISGMENLSLIEIDSYAFQGCSALNYIGIPETLERMGDSVFKNCTNARSVKFNSNKLDKGNSGHQNWWGTFDGCINLKYIDISNCKIPPVIPEYAETFKGVDVENCALLVPKGSEYLYKDADVWKNFGHIFVTHNEHINDTTIEMHLNDSVQLISKLYNDVDPEFCPPIEWRSAGYGMVTVDQTGMVTGKLYGDTHVSVGGYYNYMPNLGYQKFNIKVRPEIPIENITFDNDEIEVIYGGAPTILTVNVMPENSTEKGIVYWEINDPGYFNIRKSESNSHCLEVSYSWGKWSPYATAYITATCREDNWYQMGSHNTAPTFTEICKVKLIRLSLEKTHLDLYKGNSYRLEVTTSEDLKFKWESDNEAVATVDDEGRVYGHSTGQAKISVTRIGGIELTDTCVVNVTEKLVNQVVIVGYYGDPIKCGEEIELKAITSPHGAINDNVAWSSSDESVATIKYGEDSKHAIISTKNLGKAIITAACGDVYDTREITVDYSDAESIVIKSSDIFIDDAGHNQLNLNIGDSVRVNAYLQPLTSNQNLLSWESYAPYIATVENGTIVGISEGNTSILLSVAEQYLNEWISVTVNRRPQSIIWEQEISEIKSEESIDLTAEASSGLPVEYTVILGDASIIESKLTANAPGEIIVEASQPGNEEYLPAEAVRKSFNAMSGIDLVISNNSKVEIIGNKLRIEAGDYTLYDIYGHCIRQGYAPVHITLMPNTTYILRIGNKSVKFITK